MSTTRFTAADFGRTVREDYLRRGVMESSLVHASADNALATRSLGHPYFEDLSLGEQLSLIHI